MFTRHVKNPCILSAVTAAGESYCSVLNNALVVILAFKLIILERELRTEVSATQLSQPQHRGTSSAPEGVCAFETEPCEFRSTTNREELLLEIETSLHA